MAVDNSNANFMISTEGLYDKGKAINAERANITQAIDDIKSARSQLSSWVSENKDKYDTKLVQALKKMEEMAEVLASFGGVAVQTSERAKEAEQAIASAINGEDPVA